MASRWTLFTHLYSGGNGNNITVSLGGVNEVIHIKCRNQFLAQSTVSFSAIVTSFLQSHEPGTLSIFILK